MALAADHHHAVTASTLACKTNGSTTIEFNHWRRRTNWDTSKDISNDCLRIFAAGIVIGDHAQIGRTRSTCHQGTLAAIPIAAAAKDTDQPCAGVMLTQGGKRAFDTGSGMGVVNVGCRCIGKPFEASGNARRLGQSRQCSFNRHTTGFSGQRRDSDIPAVVGARQTSWNRETLTITNQAHAINDARITMGHAKTPTAQTPHGCRMPQQRGARIISVIENQTVWRYERKSCKLGHHVGSLFAMIIKMVTTNAADHQQLQRQTGKPLLMQRM